MVKLTKAIIKRYGISKKAWAIARGKKTTTIKKRKVYKTANKQVKTMARRFRRFRKGKRSSGGAKLNVMSTVIGGAGYGILRPMAGNAIQNIMPNFANGYEDELVIGGLALLGAWKGKGLIKTTAHHVLFTESARVVSGVAGNTSSGASGVQMLG